MFQITGLATLTGEDYVKAGVIEKMKEWPFYCTDECEGYDEVSCFYVLAFVQRRPWSPMAG